MRGVVKFDYGLEGTELRTGLPEPTPGYGKVKIKVDTATICGSDVHVLFSNLKGGGRYKLPVILGHEGSGTITEVGPGVKGYQVGDRVVSETTFETCKKCEYCYTAQFNCCNDRVGLGSGVDGYFTEYLIADETSLHLVPSDITLEAAAMLEPLATVVHGVIDLSKVTAGDVVLVIGPGPIGLMAAQVARASGAIVVLSGIDRDKERLDFARNVLGLEHVVNSQQLELKDYALKLTSNRGFDLVYECSAAKSAFAQGVDCLKKQGQFVLLSSSGQYELRGGEFYQKEIRMQGVRSTIPASWIRAIRLLEHKLVDVESLISHRLPLEDWFFGYELSRDAKAIKVALKP